MLIMRICKIMIVDPIFEVVQVVAIREASSRESEFVYSFISI